MDNYDYILNDDRLFYRKKISTFKQEDIDSICIHFKKDDSFYVHYLLDFVEINEGFEFDFLKKLLLTESIDDAVLGQLIVLFHNYEGEMDKKTLDDSIKEIRSKVNLDDLYFSV